MILTGLWLTKDPSFNGLGWLLLGNSSVPDSICPQEKCGIDPYIVEVKARQGKHNIMKDAATVV